MSTNPVGASPADSSGNWREAPPHLTADTSAATQFASARTHLGDAQSSASGARSVSPLASTGDQGGIVTPSREPSPMPSGSPAPGTASPFASTGLTARMVVDKNRNSFFIEQATGMRIDILSENSHQDSDDRSQASGPTPSEESDIPDTHTAGDSATHAGLASITEELGQSPLPAEQESALNQLRGAIAIGRERLFATTSLTVGTQDELHNHHEELEDFKVEVARRFDEMHGKLESHQSQLNHCISENVKALRDLGISETLLGKLVATAAKVRARKVSPAGISYNPLTGNTQIPPEVSTGAFTTLAPSREDESLSEFGRRAEALLSRKERAAAAFVPAAPLNPSSGDVRARAIPPHMTATTGGSPGVPIPAEDVGSISMGPRRVRILSRTPDRAPTNSLSHTGYLTANDEDGNGGDMFEEFRRETEEDIAKIVEKHLGEELIVPSRIKAPKLDTPAKYSGTNDHLTFIRWVEALTAWMRTMFYGRADPAVDKYRVSVLKNLLSETALQWYIDFVDAPLPESPVPEDFVGVLCAIHRRFITTSTAHQALRDFEAIHFRAKGGPLCLMDDLEAASKRMREPMPDVIIRQRFMKLIPATLREDLQAVRGISESYASISQMRTHSEQLWDVRPYGRNRAAPRAPIAPGRAPLLPKNGPEAKRPLVDIKNRSGPPANGTGIRGSVNRPTGNSDKTCFKCGIYGHIGSDPACPKFSDPPINRDRPRVGAQRVLESYSADDEELEDEAEEKADMPHEDWGGSQYESDSEDPSAAPQADLSDLIDATDEDGPD
ncbi:hypothetical protein K438DRAFT_1991784 [Mycena galopus ATCC 62051]|nr:hypothetical protein K438DRAFT_1991784 [Mycena galopus ATCC 62051]